MTTPYDEVPYDGAAQRFVHPDKLAAMAILHSLKPASPDNCRVLEIGCAAGETLVPMAESLPGSEFVGIDYAERQVAAGQRAIVESGLSNVRIEHLDITQAGAELDQFDYIVAHGIYSWVPPSVRESLLALCKSALKPGGIAYISFNAMPGHLFKQYVRDMLRLHTRDVADPVERVREAVTLAQLLNANLLPGTPLAALMRAYAPEMGERAGPAILHDELGEVNEAFYFSEFARDIRRHGLEYLSDVEFNAEVLTHLPPALRAVIAEKAKSFDDVEDYKDLFVCRYFRRALVCHDDAPINREVKPSPSTFDALWLTSPARPVDVEAKAGQPEGVVTFRRETGESLSTNHPVTKAAMTILGQEYPLAMPFPELLRRSLHACGVSSADAAHHAEILAANVLTSLSRTGELISLSASPDVFTVEVSERPFAAASARLAARRGELTVPNARLDLVGVDEVSLRLLILVDGTRDREALLRGFRRLVARDFAGAAEPAMDDVEALLGEFAQSALLLR
ncbi:MAG: hypothetical protein C0506_07880 [Anaerolinea sp.]|nr:hypothetical protein [Anaerolinea sp.]